MEKAYVIGIAGGSASGKSTLADALQKSLEGLRIKAIHMDHYFKPSEERPFSEAPITGAMFVDDNHPETVDLPQLRKDLHRVINENEYDVLIVEGLLTLYDKEIYRMLDLKLFVDCRCDERIVRRLRRNMQWGLSFDEISDVYLDLVRYRHDEYVEPSKWRADFILNGSSPSDRALAIVSAYIKSVVGG